MLQNLHTHTLFCDGADTPKEMIEKAIALGFDSIGFSSHAPTSVHTDWEMSDTDSYKKEISELKLLYREKIKIFLGIELDYYSSKAINCDSFDYKIGSVHMAFKDGRQIDFDNTVKASERYIKEYFAGNSLDYAKLYYETVADMPCVFDYDIVGHFDLLTKFSEKNPHLIDVQSKAYKNVALEALYAVREKRDFFEINTGAISRGYRTTPYPAPFILKEMKHLDCKLVLTSDCHNKNLLDCGFKEAKQYDKAHGFDSLYYLTQYGFISEKI